MAREHGFTLIEVVVALAILGLVLTVIFRIHSTGLTGMARADGLQRAAFIAEGLAAQLNTAAMPLRPGGSLAGEADGYRWRIETDRYPGALRQASAFGNRQAMLARVRIAVESTAGARFEMTTVTLVPAR